MHEKGPRWVIIALALVVTVGLAGCHNNDNQRTKSASQQTVKSSSEKQVEQGNGSYDLSAIKASFVGVGFTYATSTYNGESVDKAMDEGNAPQNSVSDSVVRGYFVSTTKARVMQAHSAQPTTIAVEITHKYVKVGAHKFSYTTRNNAVTSFGESTTENSDGVKIQYEMRWADTAKAEITEMEETSSTDAASESTSNASVEVGMNTVDTIYKSSWFANNKKALALNLYKGTWTQYVEGTYGPEIPEANWKVQNVWTIKKVLKHPDGSYVFNLAGKDGYHALLFVPEEKTLTKNWQKNTAITDNTSTDFARIAESDVQKTDKYFDLTDCYNAFQKFSDEDSVGIFSPAG